MVKKVHAAHILVSSQTDAEFLKTAIDNGKDFAALAKEHSACPSGKNGGDLGWFGKGAMVKEFEKAAFSLDLLQVSEPFKTQFGWHIVKVLDKQ